MTLPTRSASCIRATGSFTLKQELDSEEYWYVYSLTEQKLGYVNKDYLVYEGMLINAPYCDVSVAEGYLALRTEKPMTLPTRSESCTAVIQSLS